MVAKQWQDEFRRKLDSKLAGIEEQILRDSNNQETGQATRMPANFFTVFMLIGEETGMLERLRSLVEGLAESATAYAFLRWSDDIGQRVHEAVENAADNYAKVPQLNTILLCPIYFASEGTDVSLLKGVEDVRDCMKDSGRGQIWQPYLVIHWNRDRYGEAYRGITQMKELIHSLPCETVHRCCLLSDKDEKNFTVESENILETIALCTVLQNTEPENDGAADEIRRKVQCDASDVETGDIFFTARSASVCNPVRTVTLWRMISAFKYMRGDTDEKSDNVLENMRFDFIARALKPCVDKLPHMGGKISFFPLYGVMGSDGGDLHRRLEEQIKRYYEMPLRGGEELAAAIKKGFFEEYFQQNGSLEDLRTSIQQKNGELFTRRIDVAHSLNVAFEEALSSKRAKKVLSGGPYERARMHCIKMVEELGNGQLAELTRQLRETETVEQIRQVQEKMDMVIDCVRERMNGLGKIETVLPVGQTDVHVNYEAVQDDWFKMRAMGQGWGEVGVLNRKFDTEIQNIFLGSEGRFENLLDYCYQAVRSGIESNRKYIDSLGTECAGDPERAKEHAKKVEDGWCYALHFLNRNSTSDITCLVGNGENAFCKTLKEREQFHAKLFEFRQLDKLGVLHISSQFGQSDITVWDAIKERGQEGMDDAATEHFA